MLTSRAILRTVLIGLTGRTSLISSTFSSVAVVGRPDRSPSCIEPAGQNRIFASLGY